MGTLTEERDGGPSVGIILSQRDLLERLWGRPAGTLFAPRVLVPCAHVMGATMLMFRRGRVLPSPDKSQTWKEGTLRFRFFFRSYTFQFGLFFFLKRRTATSK